jgi:hypothetical protein
MLARWNWASRIRNHAAGALSVKVGALIDTAATPGVAVDVALGWINVGLVDVVVAEEGNG